MHAGKDQRPLYIGLMSGTSLDGVDAALCEIDEQQCILHGQFFLPYPENIKQELLELHHVGMNELALAASMANRLADLYSDATLSLLSTSQVSNNQIVAVGCHGQTIRHRPEMGYTIQLVNGARLAEQTGITVVCDFRSRDIAAGGQGAPLVPAFHQAVFGDRRESRAIINIGGIANITYLPMSSDSIIGFDTGPGNMLMDAWIAQEQGVGFDADGQWAREGSVIDTLLERMLADDFFTLPPPKSTGRDWFNLDWLKKQFDGNESAVDIQRTLLELSARTIADSLHNYCSDVSSLYLCGGGARNQLLTERLRQLMHPVKIVTTDTLGIGVDWVEAVAFAWLAYRCIAGLPGNLPSVTGAKGHRILGAVYAR